MRAASEPTLTSTYHPCNQVAGILRGHVTGALRLLGTARPDGRRIHAARQELKRARATLRLLRGSVDPDHYRLEDATIRNAARQLNEARDAEVLIRAFSRLQESVGDELSGAMLAPLRKALMEERRIATSSALRTRLTAVRKLLMQSRERIPGWLVANDLDLLTSAMRRTYRKGRTCYRAARESHTDEDLHAWRRQVKYSAYQLEAIGPLAPAGMAKRLRKSARVAKLLGRDHDLALLHERIDDARLDAAVALQLASAIRRERAKLQRKALQLGERLYRAKPRAFPPLN